MSSVNLSEESKSCKEEFIEDSINCDQTGASFVYSSAHVRDLDRLRIHADQMKKIGWNDVDIRNPVNSKPKQDKETLEWVDVEIDVGIDEYEGSAPVVVDEQKLKRILYY